jgi:hypothetical protein
LRPHSAWEMSLTKKSCPDFGFTTAFMSVS